jgi:hypothetical protein
MEIFRLRAGYKTKEFLIEFCGNHRDKNFPNVARLLKLGLSSKRNRFFKDMQENIYNFDGFISTWEYRNGCYELDNDIWTLFIHAPDNNDIIISDIEKALLDSGEFEKEEVGFNEYT